MAGNIVKWWKHKILGGYKQFSVQECTTDSEELMYHQVRAPSSCSAPPDLLLVSDRENNIPLKSPVVNIITTATTSSSSQKQQHHHHQQQQQQQQLQHQQQQHNTKEHLYNKNVQNMKISNNKSGGRPINLQSSAAMSSHTQQQQSQQQQNEANQQQFRHHTKEEPRIHLEEFTCDVSVEGGKSTQPLQFSFTFYDLDGHHGKITKDDIVGIVYTIYESIGKSVVVPHCGSKTINVRLTVSPEGKSKASANKLKKMQPDGTTLLESCKAPAATAASALQGHARRQHRYRPRKLIKSDDEDDDSISEKDIQLTAMAASASANKSKSHASKYNNRAKAEQPEQLAATVAGECCQTMENNRNLGNNIDMSASSCQHDSNLYENIRTTNLKCCPTKDAKKCGAQVTEECRECAATTLGGGVQYKSSDVYLKQASSRVRMLRKARKQKYQDHCLETRQRSLSLGSEACWKSRHAKHSPQLAQPTTAAVDASKQQPLQSQQHSEDVLDGVQLRKPHRLGRPNSLAANRSSAECWKSAMNRSDLITIIRESMEKNRLSFQMNGKPQASVSPIRQSHQRQRSNTVSKIPTLIAHHNSSITSHNNSSTHPHSPSSKPINNEPSIHDINSSSTNCQHQPHQLQQQQQQQPSPHSHHHLQPHIPIYHQHMAINPAVLAAQSGFVHSKTNLCGYDSFLHATICGGGTSHSPPPPPPAPNGSHVVAHTQQPIAAVQPIMNAINAAASAGPKLSYHQQQQRYHQHPSPKIYAHPTSTQQQIKTSKILRSGTFSQTQQHPAAAAAPAATTTTAVVQQSSPQYHGYQRLASASATKHNLAALNSQNPSMARAQVEHLERWLHEREKCAAGALKSQKSKKDVKNYDNLLFAKLTEKLQDSTLNAADEVETEKRRLDIEQRRKQRAFARAQKGNGLANNSAHHNSPGRKSNPANQQPQQQQQLQPQMILSPVTSEQSNYAALVPINGDPIECENLLGSQTSDEDNSAETPATKDATADGVAKETSALLQVTGDLLDFNDEADAEAEADAVKKQAQVLHVEGSASNMNSEAGRTSSSSNSSGAAVVATCPSNAAHNSNASSSLIHRYVHEHIHHHYHHFEDKAE